jgi:C4-dicarboxylate-specific signal transduction histidine kinase
MNSKTSKIAIVGLNIVVIVLAFFIYSWVNRAFLDKARDQHSQDVINLSNQIKNEYFFNEGKTITNLISKLELDFEKEPNKKLEIIKDVSGSALAYLLDKGGTVKASAYVDENTNLIGKNYAFRPYFKNAIMGDNYIYTAVGVTTKKRGIYYSTPIYKRDKIRNVLVIKKNFTDIDQLLKSYNDKLLLVNPDGIVFSTNNDEWLLRKIENKFGEYDKFKYAELTSFKPLPMDIIAKKEHGSSSKLITKDFQFRIMGETWKIISVRELTNFRPKSMTNLSIILTLMTLAMLNLFAYFVLNINFSSSKREE